MSGLEPPDGRVQHPFDHLLAFAGIKPCERAVEAEHRDAVHRGPEDVLKARATFGSDHAYLAKRYGLRGSATRSPRPDPRHRPPPVATACDAITDISSRTAGEGGSTVRSG